MTRTGLCTLSKQNVPSYFCNYCNVFFMNSEQVRYIIITGEINQDTSKDNHTDENERKGLPEPLWLLILEVIAGVSFISLLTLCTITGLRRCRATSSGSGDSVPWTRAVSWKENTVISIGRCLFFFFMWVTGNKLYALLITSRCLCRWWPPDKCAEDKPAGARRSLRRIQQHNWIFSWNSCVQRNSEGWPGDRCCVAVCFGALLEWLRGALLSEGGKCLRVLFFYRTHIKVLLLYIQSSYYA